ncbi:UNVERIFIED_CONTAM: hypothetical protein GTU68_002723 [Idotea baltica]|nr:hypothetical protein [Idotea baltica]
MRCAQMGVTWFSLVSPVDRPEPKKSVGLCLKASLIAGRRKPKSCCSPPPAATIWNALSCPPLQQAKS